MVLEWSKVVTEVVLQGESRWRGGWKYSPLVRRDALDEKLRIDYPGSCVVHGWRVLQVE